MSEPIMDDREFLLNEIRRLVEKYIKDENLKAGMLANINDSAPVKWIFTEINQSGVLMDIDDCKYIKDLFYHFG